MRRTVDPEKLAQFMEAFGRASTSPGTVYLTGGATALLLGLRGQTIDIDVKLHPEPGGAFEAIAKLKERLEVNVELAAPDDFIPPLPGWRERSQWIVTVNSVDFRHYDFYGQALAKIERGLPLDVEDAATLVARGWVELAEMERLFEEIRPGLVRYPAIDPAAFEAKVCAFVRAHRVG